MTIENLKVSLKHTLIQKKVQPYTRNNVAIVL